MPHGGCYLWTQSLIALHAFSDAAIALAYYSIPFTLLYFVRRRRDLKFHWIFICFAAFVLACGTTHLMEIWNIWHANYWLSGCIKAITALISVPTAFLLIKLLPQALALPGTDDLRKAHEELEIRVRERTAELEKAAQNLQAEIKTRMTTEEILRRTDRALRTISDCNQALVRATTEPALLSEICRVIAEQGGYRLVWVGFAEHDANKSVRIAAHAGYSEGYLEQLQLSWADTERGQGPTGVAIRTGQLVICNDFQTDPKITLWREAALQRGYASAMVLPLRNGGTFGALTIYAAKADAFNPAEIELLKELADDLSYGIQALHARVEQERAEAVLQHSEQNYREIFNATNEAIFLHDATTGEILDVNDAMLRLYGFTAKADVLTCDYSKLCANVPPYTVAEASEYIRRAVAEGPQIFEWQARRIDGERFWVEVSLRSSQVGGAGRILAVVRNINERKRAEEQMNVQFSALSAAANAIVIANFDGEVEWVNPAFTRLTGYSAQEAIGNNLRLLSSGQHPRSFYANLWTTILTGNVWHGEIINRRKDGQLYTEDMTVTPVWGTDGTIAHFVAIKLDVTEQRQLEKRMQQSQKMEAIGTLAGGIAHDFNNILASMFGYAYLLQQDTEDNPAAQESVTEILKATGRAKELVQQILTFSRQREQKPQVIQIDPVVKEAIKFLRASLPAQIRIELNLAADVPAVLADPTQIYQVAINLATNALHAMEGRAGQLTVSLEPFQPDARFIQSHPDFRNLPYARLIVADTGHGMDAKTMERIFEPFFTTKPVGKGTGLGLAVVHGIVQSHNGIITVDSECGRGTTFSLYFPGATKNTVSTAGPAHEVSHGNGEKILLLDDEPALTAALQRLLVRLNYQVTTSNNAREAIRWCEKNPARFDLIITDLTMPEMTGLDVARQLQALRPGLPVILASGFSADLSRETLQAAGICELLDKPISRTMLAQAVRRALTGQKGRPVPPSTPPPA